MFLSIAMYHQHSIKHQSFVYTQLNNQTVLFRAIQFSISHLFALSLNVKQFYLTLSGAAISSQSSSESDGNERVLCIPQSSSLSDCLVSYLGQSVGESYSSAKMQLVYSTASADLATSSCANSIDSFDSLSPTIYISHHTWWVF